MYAINERVFVITRFYTNIYIINIGSGLVLIDTHFSSSVVDTLQQSLPKHGFSLNQITHILITHAHFDHVGGLAALQKAVNARTYAHRRDALIVRGEQSISYARRDDMQGIDWLMTYFMPSSAPPARVDVELKEGDRLDGILPDWEVVELAGHSYGQIGFWWQAQRLLIGGDVMMHLPWGLTMPPRAASPDWTAAKQSVRKIAAMGVETLCLGHGSPIIGGAAHKIQVVAQRYSE
jgi:glyoxylase-like metal-dependent hydrolase (beta-lactamase superfamily II)